MLRSVLDGLGTAVIDVCNVVGIVGFPDEVDDGIAGAPSGLERAAAGAAWTVAAVERGASITVVRVTVGRGGFLVITVTSLTTLRVGVLMAPRRSDKISAAADEVAIGEELVVLVVVVLVLLLVLELVLPLVVVLVVLLVLLTVIVMNTE